MSELFAPGVGAVLSADIAVPEHERELRFYSRVLCTGDAPLWREADLMNNLGMPIIGLGARTPEYAELPLQWMPHVQVSDVSASVRRALELGGSVVMDARDDDGASQWAVLLDPGGAAFGLVPVVAAAPMAPADGGGAGDGPSGGAGDEPAAVGRIAWVDLTVPDAEAIRDFYQQVVGWSVQEVAMTDGEERYADYGMLGESGNPVTGICYARGINEGLPPVWMIYLPVGDIDESLRRVEEEGGRIIRSTRGDDGKYAYAAVEDPVGVALALVPS